MRSSLRIGLGLLVAASWAGRARSQAPVAPPRETFQQLDANGDKVIEPGEVPEKARPAFERLLKLGDADKDGKLSAPEFRDLIQSMRGPGAPAAGANLGVFSGDPMAQFKAMDKDGDGKVTRTEFPGRPAMFERVDANKDGVLEASEVKALAGAAKKAAPAPAAAAGMPGGRFKAMDKDGDGKLSKDEYQGPPAFFGRLDADKDGSLTPAEMAEAPRVMAEALRMMDKDGDGKISRDEFRGAPQQFDRLDADKDGFVTTEEIRNALPAGQPGTAAKKEAKKKDA